MKQIKETKGRNYYFNAYIKERKSIKTIGDELGLSFTCIRNRLLKHKIKLRSKGWITRSKSKNILDGINLIVRTDNQECTLTFNYNHLKYGVKRISSYGYFALTGLAMRTIPKGKFNLEQEKALIKKSLYKIDVKEYVL